MSLFLSIILVDFMSLFSSIHPDFISLFPDIISLFPDIISLFSSIIHSDFMSLFLSIILVDFMSLCPFIHPSIHPDFMSLSIHPSIYITNSIHPSTGISLFPSIHITISIHPSILKKQCHLGKDEEMEGSQVKGQILNASALICVMLCFFTGFGAPRTLWLSCPPQSWPPCHFPPGC